MHSPRVVGLPSPPLDTRQSGAGKSGADAHGDEGLFTCPAELVSGWGDGRCPALLLPTATPVGATP